MTPASPHAHYQAYGASSGFGTCVYTSRYALYDGYRTGSEGGQPVAPLMGEFKGITVILATLVPLILNLLPGSSSLTPSGKLPWQLADQISLIIDQAMLESRFVEVSLASGKSYVGSPIQGTFGHRDDGDVAIIPVASGYRDNETQALVMTTNYAPAINSLPGSKLGSLKVAFPMRDIVSARLLTTHYM